MLVYQRVAGRTLALGHWDIARYCHCPKKSLRKRLGLRLGLPWVYHGLLFTVAQKPQTRFASAWWISV